MVRVCELQIFSIIGASQAVSLLGILLVSIHSIA